MRKKSSVGNGESGVGNQSTGNAKNMEDAMFHALEQNVPRVGTKRPTRWDKARLI